MSKASNESMAALHGKLADVLKEGLGIRDENGLPSASLLSVARQFLKDNHIEVGEAKKGTALHGLSELPEFTEDGNVTPISRAR